MFNLLFIILELQITVSTAIREIILDCKLCLAKSLNRCFKSYTLQMTYYVWSSFLFLWFLLIVIHVLLNISELIKNNISDENPILKLSYISRITPPLHKRYLSFLDLETWNRFKEPHKVSINLIYIYAYQYTSMQIEKVIIYCKKNCYIIAILFLFIFDTWVMIMYTRYILNKPVAFSKRSWILDK